LSPTLPSGKCETEVVQRMVFYACTLKVPPALAMALAEQESGWDSQARSPKGALGVLQVLPSTAEQYGLDGSRLLQFDYGAYAGLIILRDLLDRFQGDEAVSLAAYYAGPGFSKKRYSRKTELEIAEYVHQVLVRRSRITAIRCPE
jgi:soluble lytic murein transglycosylase-like protein